MLSLHDRALWDEVLRLQLEPTLRKLIEDALRLAEANGLMEMTHIVIIEPGDTEAGLIDELGRSPVSNLYSQVRFGGFGFKPYWDALRFVGGWFETIVTMGNPGFAYLLFIPDREGVLPDLLERCCIHAEGRGA